MILKEQRTLKRLPTVALTDSNPICAKASVVLMRITTYLYLIVVSLIIGSSNMVHFPFIKAFLAIYVMCVVPFCFRVNKFLILVFLCQMTTSQQRHNILIFGRHVKKF